MQSSNDTLAVVQTTRDAVLERANLPRDPEWRRRADELGDDIATLAAHLTAAEYQLLCKIRDFDDCDGWYHHGARSCAHWLNWRIGLGLVAAREKVRVARALAQLPRISAAMECGALSYSKVRALTRIATPETEQDLLENGSVGTASQVEKMVRLYRQACRPDELECAARQQADKFLRTYWDDDGMLVIEGRLPAEEGALVEQALEMARCELFDRRASTTADAGDSAEACDAGEPAEACEAGEPAKACEAGEPAEACEAGEPAEACEAGEPAKACEAGDSAETHDSPSAAPPERTRSWPTQRAEALVRVAEAALAGRESRHGQRAQVTVHVDAELLADPCAAGRCEIEEGAAIAADTMRRLACDADLLAVVHGEKGEPLGPGRRTRKVSDRLRRALWERDRGCTFPGCTNQRFLHGHHLRHWADGGSTHLENLTSLPSYHHLLVHEGGFSIVERNGGLHFLNPAGERVLPAPPPPVVGDPVPSWRRESARSIDANTTMPDWDGEHPDYEEMLRPLFERDRGPVRRAG